MPARTITADGLIDEYAQPIAAAVDIDHTDYDRTPNGLASLLTDTANRLSSMDQTRDWLEEAAADLEALGRSGVVGRKAQTLLKRIDRNLYEVKSELELY